MILLLPPLRQRLVRPGAPPPRRHQRGFIMTPYRYASGGDPYFSNVVLLVDASAESNGSTPSGIDVIGKTPTWRGNAQCKTDQAVFGTSSIYLDGANDRVSFADSADFDFGAGDFTVECWFRHDGAYTADQVVLSQANAFGGFYSVQVTHTGSDNVAFKTSDGATTHNGNSAASSAPADTWVHCAISRVGSNFYGLCGGVATTFHTSGFTLMNSTGAFTIGAYVDADGSAHFKGWIDQIRVTKGVGRYTGGTPYTQPAAAWPHA